MLLSPVPPARALLTSAGVTASGTSDVILAKAGIHPERQDGLPPVTNGNPRRGRGNDGFANR